MAIIKFLLLPILILSITWGYSQEGHILLFSKVISKGKTEQSRFEILEINKSWRILYAPYGKVPVAFTDIVKTDSSLTFKWDRDGAVFSCALKLVPDSILHFKGIGLYQLDTIHLTMRSANIEDAHLQGNFLAATDADLRILTKAAELLGEGANWNREDNRICEGGKVSLFCALYQASIRINGEYRHLSPVMRMVRRQSPC